MRSLILLAVACIVGCGDGGRAALEQAREELKAEREELAAIREDHDRLLAEMKHATKVYDSAIAVYVGEERERAVKKLREVNEYYFPRVKECGDRLALQEAKVKEAQEAVEKARQK